MATLTSYAAVTTLNEGMWFYSAIDTDADGDYESRRVSLATLRAALNDANSTIIKWSKGADIASASALAVSVDGNYFDVTGTTTITSISEVGIGTVILLQFDGALVLTHHATDLVLPDGVNITTAAGDHAIFVQYATGDWRLVSYQASVVQQRNKKGADVASATALPVIKDGNYFDVTGTTAITSIDSLGIGTMITLQFDGAMVLTHHATDLVLPGGSNITTVAGDHAVFVEYASGDWRLLAYQKYQPVQMQPVYIDAAPQALSGAGAVDIVSPITNFTSTGATDALTLADSTVLGQMKVLNHVVDGGGYVLTPTTFANGTAITVTDVSVSITLMWTASGWRLVGQTGIATVS